MEKAMLEAYIALPCRDDGTVIDREGLSVLIDQYYAGRGYDSERGWPTTDTLLDLGLEGVARALERLKSVPGPNADLKKGCSDGL